MKRITENKRLLKEVDKLRKIVEILAEEVCTPTSNCKNCDLLVRKDCILSQLDDLTDGLAWIANERY